MAVHDVAVDDARAGGHDLLDLRGEPREVGREDARRDAGQTGHSIDPPQLTQAMIDGARHAHDRRVLAAVGADRAQLVAVQAVHAAVAARRGSSGAATARGSSGTPCRARPRSVIALDPRRRDLEARRAGLVRAAASRARRPRTRRGPRAAPRSPPGSACRSTTPARRPDGPRPPRRPRIRRCSATSPSIRSGVIRQRRSGRACSVPRPEHGGSASTRSNGPSARGAGRVADLDARRSSRPSARTSRRSCSARSASLLDRDDLALVAHQRGEVRRLAAGRGAEVEHALARLRRRARGATRLRRARLRHERARRATAGGRRRRTAPSTTTASAAPPHAPADRRGELLGRRLQAVGAQRELGRLVERAPSARVAVSRAVRVAPQRRRASRGTEWRTRLVVDRVERAPGPRASARRSTALTRPAPRAALGELDGLGDRRVGGDAVEEQQLERGRAAAPRGPAGRASCGRRSARR